MGWLSCFFGDPSLDLHINFVCIHADYYGENPIDVLEHAADDCRVNLCNGNIPNPTITLGGPRAVAVDCLIRAAIHRRARQHRSSCIANAASEIWPCALNAIRLSGP